MHTMINFCVWYWKYSFSNYDTLISGHHSWLRTNVIFIESTICVFMRLYYSSKLLSLQIAVLQITITSFCCILLFHEICRLCCWLIAGFVSIPAIRFFWDNKIYKYAPLMTFLYSCSTVFSKHRPFMWWALFNIHGTVQHTSVGKAGLWIQNSGQMFLLYRHVLGIL